MPAHMDRNKITSLNMYRQIETDPPSIEIFFKFEKKLRSVEACPEKSSPVQRTVCIGKIVTTTFPVESFSIFLNYIGSN